MDQADAQFPAITICAEAAKAYKKEFLRNHGLKLSSYTGSVGKNASEVKQKYNVIFMTPLPIPLLEIWPLDIVSKQIMFILWITKTKIRE